MTPGAQDLQDVDLAQLFSPTAPQVIGVLSMTLQAPMPAIRVLVAAWEPSSEGFMD